MISFIIPAYNSEKTIKKAILSILKQKETDIEYEIIVVDDGSTDKTDTVMKKFKNENKVRYYVKENSGVAGTRNLGVAKAKGDYIIFVDSDDFISKTLLKDIKPYIKKDIDLIKWNCTIVDEEHNLIDKPNSAQFGRVTGEEGFNLLFGKDNFIDCLWNYAIKKSIIEKFPTRNVS